MRVQFSAAPQGVIGLTGHAGCGHAHSNNGFIQDDSGGLAAMLALLQEAADIPLTIAAVTAHTGRHGGFEIRTVSGGVGRCSARRGVTPQEARLAQAVEGHEAIRTQALAVDAFGRMYGQGAHEVPVALQAAMANAALDSFVQTLPDRFHHAWEGVPGNGGRIIGTVLDVAGVPVSVMAVVNVTDGGIGPNEDLEGNAFARGKKAVMQPLNMHNLPTLVMEGKVFTLPACTELAEDTFLVRASEDDNTEVAEACMEALADLGFAATWPRGVLKRVPGALQALTQNAGEHIAALGQRLAAATTAEDKVATLAEIITFASQDAGGLSFMSDSVHEIVGGPGLMPGTAAVLSLLVPQSYIDHHVMPCLTDHDVTRYVAVIKATVPRLHVRLKAAQAMLQSRQYTGDLDALL